MAEFSSEILTPETGELLRNARLAKGLSEDDVAVKLRIHRQYVECMESGDLRSLPPEPYRKAFVKEYARFLGVKLESLRAATASEEKNEGILGAVSAITKDITKEAASLTKEVAQTTIKTTEDVAKKIEENFMDAVDEIRGKELWDEADEVRRERLGIQEEKDTTRDLAVRRASEPSGRYERRQPIQRLDLDRVVRKEAADYQMPEREEEELYSSGMSRSTKVIIGLLIVIAAVVVYSVVTKRSQDPAVVIPSEQQRPEVQPSKKPAAPAPAKIDSAKIVPPADTTLTFSIKASDSVWVSIMPDIGGGFRGIIKAGETKQFSAKEKYIVSIGNQRSASMTLDGKPLSSLPTVSGSSLVVRNVVLTRDKAVISTAADTEPAKAATQTSTPVKTPAVKTPTVKKTPAKKAPQEIKTIPTTPPVLPKAQ